MNDVMQEDFWDANPCGREGDFVERMQQRNSMEHWFGDLLREIASRHKNVLEVACGAGIEAYHICSYLSSESRYTGIDYSEKSIDVAQGMGDQAARALSLNVEPNFLRADALNLPFPDNAFDGIYSIGGLHHTPNPSQAVAEVHRVLQPGGLAYVVLYRKFSPKVSLAKGLRLAQSFVDKLFGTDRILYNFLYGHHFSQTLGTMLLECFGVPYMFWYSEKEVRNLFKDFELIDASPYGYNFPHIKPRGDGRNLFGYFWRVIVKKRTFSS